ncbi:peptidase M24, structural domain-containing protein [Chlamydoabsidia padenii]|nr:peptidase M24, structural domain-containing protein [Chlamydoabsidia padenii]
MSPHTVAPIRPYQKKLATKENCHKVCQGLLESCPQEKNGFIYHRGAVYANRHDTDIELDYRQESYFFYLTGVEDPGYHVLVDINTTKVHLITPSIDSTECLWKCPPAAPNKLLRLYDIDSVHDEQDLDQLLYNVNPSTIYTLNTTDTSLIPTCFKSRLNNGRLLRQVLDECRLIKSAWEIKLLRQVTQASSQAHIALMRDAHPYQPESELVALFHWICSRYGVTRQAYIPIVVSGKRTAVLHETRYKHCLPGNDPHAMVLVDAGGERFCYATDITRCYPVSGVFSNESRTIYEIVLKMQETVLANLKPGVMWSDMEQLAIRILCQELCRIGILIGDEEELLELKIPTTFYFHGLGHSVGLDVHDVGGRKSNDHDDNKDDEDEGLSTFLVGRPLEANMVLTVEPGIYFNDAWITTWTQCPGYEHYYNMDRIRQYSVVGGIRIEDTVVITELGHENLTTSPKKVKDIEQIMASHRDNNIMLY